MNDEAEQKMAESQAVETEQEMAKPRTALILRKADLQDRFQAGVLNKASYIALALEYDYGLRIEQVVDIKAFSERWQIDTGDKILVIEESQVLATIAKLKKAGSLAVKLDAVQLSLWW